MNVHRGAQPGHSAYYVKYRPVFEAAAPGAKISPEFAGRFAADFALGSRACASRHPAVVRKAGQGSRDQRPCSPIVRSQLAGVGRARTAGPSVAEAARRRYRRGR